MKLPYGYVLIDEEIVVHEEKADAVRSIFECYLAGASLGKIVDMLHEKCIFSPSGNPKWGRAAATVAGQRWTNSYPTQNIFPLLA